MPRSDLAVIPTRAATLGDALSGYANAVAVALLRSRRISIGLADGSTARLSRPRALAAILVGYLAALLAPLYLLRTIYLVAFTPGDPVSLSGGPSDWLSHLSYWRAGPRFRPWLGSYHWLAVYPPLGPAMVGILGVSLTTLVMLLGFLVAALAVGHASWVGIVAALYAASSVPLRLQTFAGRPEVIGWALVLAAVAMWPVHWGATLAAILLAGLFHPLFCGNAWTAISGARPAFHDIRREVPTLRLWAGMFYPCTPRLALVVASLLACAWTAWPPLLALHIVVCFWALEGHSRASTTPRPVSVDQHVATLREHIPAASRLGFEHDPDWTQGTHLQWLASYALPGHPMFGGATFDHAPLEVVHDAMELQRGGNWRETVAKHRLTHLLTTSPTWPTKAVRGFILPAFGPWPARDLYVHEVGHA